VLSIGTTAELYKRGRIQPNQKQLKKTSLNFKRDILQLKNLAGTVVFNCYFNSYQDVNLPLLIGFRWANEF